MDQIKIGLFIGELRREQGITQQALGEELGVTNKTVSRWENGVYMPDIEMFGILSRRFGVTINELMSGERLTTETEIVKAADENILDAGRSAAFSVREKTKYWKKKWLKNNTAWLIVSALFWVAWFALVIWKKYAWMTIPCGPLAVALFLFWRNRMAAYVEGKVYGEAPRHTADGR